MSSATHDLQPCTTSPGCQHLGLKPQVHAKGCAWAPSASPSGCWSQNPTAAFPPANNTSKRGSWGGRARTMAKALPAFSVSTVRRRTWTWCQAVVIVSLQRTMRLEFRLEFRFISGLVNRGQGLHVLSIDQLWGWLMAPALRTISALYQLTEERVWPAWTCMGL